MNKTGLSAVVATHDPVWPVQGGGALRTLLVARGLAGLGFRVCLVAPAGDRREVDGVPTLSLAAPRKQRSQIMSALKFNLRLLVRGFGHLARADVFVSHNTIACLFVPLLKRFFGFAFFLDITDVHAEYLVVGRRNLPERMARPFLLWYEYLIIRCADRVVAATAQMRELLVSKGVAADRVEVVYDGVVAGSQSVEKTPGAAETVIHLGAVDRQHGLDVFIRAVPLVLAARPQARFMIVGGGRELERVRELAESLGVANSCEFTGTVDMAAASACLKRASVGVIARPRTLANDIVTTLKLFDYWASATAVVASELPGIAEIAAHGRDVLFFAPGDSADMAKKILELMADNGLKNRLALAGVARAGDFDFRKACRRIAEMAAETKTKG